MTIEEKIKTFEKIFDRCFYDIDKKMFHTIITTLQDTGVCLQKRLNILYCIRTLIYLHNIYIEDNFELDNFKNIALKRKFYKAKEAFLCNINLILDFTED